MEAIIKKKRVTAVLFLLVVFLGAVLNWKAEGNLLMEYFKTTETDLKNLSAYVSGLEAEINENFYARYDFINAYGYLQKVLGKYEENGFEVVKDKNGKLYYTYFTDKIKDTTEYVERTLNLKNSIQDKEVNFIYVSPPDKFVGGYSDLPLGIPYHMINETIDVFLQQLEENGIDTIDFRDYLEESGIQNEDLFFNTDHHWQVKTAFWATNTFFHLLKSEYGEQIENEEMYCELDNYNVITYENSFLGSMGRKTGIYYTEVDDFDLIYPQFETNVTLENSDLEDGLTLKGRFEEALLATPVLRSTNSPFDKDIYGIYLYGNQAYAHIINNENPDGLKILIIKDSFAVPFAAFASLRCSDIYMLDPRYYEGGYEAFINSTDLDYVLLMYSPEDVAEEFFPFGE